MAKKEVVFGVKVETGKSIKNVQDLDKELNNLNKTTDKTTKATEETGKAFDENATFAEKYGEELQPLTTRLGEAEDRMYELALAGEQSSEEYQRLLEVVTNYRRTQIQTDAVVDASSQTMSQKLVGSVEFGAAAFQGYESAVALAGVESEALVQTMVKLQAIQGLVGSLQSLQENYKNLTATFSGLGKKVKNFGDTLKKNTIFQKANNIATTIASGVMKLFGVSVAQTSIGFKALKAAIISTGIGALIIGVGALISKMGDWISSEKELEEASKARAKAQQDAIRDLEVEQEIERLRAEAQGQSLSESIKMQIQHTKDLRQQYRDQAADQYNHYSKLYDDDWGPINDSTKAAYDSHIELINQAEQQGNKLKLLNAKLQLAIEQEAIENTEKNNEEIIRLEKMKNQALENEYNREIALLRAKGEDTFELEKEELKRKIELEIENQSLLNQVLGQESEIVKDLKNKLEVLEINHNKKISGERKQAYQKYKSNLQKRNSEIIATLKMQYDDQVKLVEQYNDLRIEAIEDGRKRELEENEQAYKKFERQFLDERIQDEINAQNELFKIGKIKAEEYEKNISEIRSTARERLTEQERQILVTREIAFLRSIEKINKDYDQQDLESEKVKEERRKELLDHYQNLFKDQFQTQLDDERKANEEAMKQLEEAHKLGLISEGEFYLSKLKLANDLADAEKEIEREKNEYIKEQQIKAREEQLKGITKVLEAAQQGLDGLNQINDLVNEIDQARLNKIATNREENLESLDQNLEAQLRREDLTAEQKAQIEENFAQQKFTIQQKAFEEEEKIKKAQFNRDKALKLAQVSIDTASAIVKAIQLFGPPPSPLGIAGIASAGVIGLTQALAILNQQYQGGSAPSPPQIGGGQSAGALAGAGASAFTANTQAEQTDLSTIGEDVPVSQVVVLESDITGTQSKVAVQEAKSSF